MAFKIKVVESVGNATDHASALTTALAAISIDADSSPAITSIAAGTRVIWCILYEET